MAFTLVLLNKRQNRKSQQYLLSLNEEQENLMRTLSMEIHDNVNQVLGAINWNFLALLDGLQLSQEKQILAEKIKAMTDTLFQDTENIGHALNPDYVARKSFIPSIRDEADWLNATGRLQCDLEINGQRQEMPDQTSLMAFRIAQESLNNAIKYSEAKKVTIQLNFGEQNFDMCITDNGKGIDISTIDFKKGTGMNNMQRRAKIVGGHISITSIPGKGTAVTLVIPNAFTKRTL
ncbi:sensor histidine kinase [Rurimicrobium arvi]